MEDSAFKLCRFCKEQIRREAIKCRFCAEWLESSNQPRLDSPSKLTPPEETVEPASPIKSVGNALNEKYALQRPLAVEKPRAESPRGIGGWLLFFCISLTILGPLWSIIQINNAWMNAQRALDRFPAAKTAVFFRDRGLSSYRLVRLHHRLLNLERRALRKAYS